MAFSSIFNPDDADALFMQNRIQDLFMKGPVLPDYTPYSVVTYGAVAVRHSIWPVAVVVKTYRQTLSTTPRPKVVEERRKRTYREALMWVRLQSSPHANLNAFHGLLFADNNIVKEATAGIPSIVTEFVKHDSVEYTERRPFPVRLEVVSSQSNSAQPQPLISNEVTQVARGLAHLHSLGIVHGDMKPDNFRITRAGVPKIIDLGLGRYQTNDRTGLTTTIFPTFRFIAPELILSDEDDVLMSVTTHSDVYAWSMTALQILDGRGMIHSLPFKTSKTPLLVKKAVLAGEWPVHSLYTGVTAPAWDALATCWTLDWETRPSMASVVATFTTLAS